MNDTQSLIGKLISGHQERDAIHIAVAPMIAGEYLRPGDHVSVEGGRAHQVGKQVGIVDPFLQMPVSEGAAFWLFLYPNTITSLRHNWAHPAFATVAAKVDDNKEVSRAWMTKWAVEHMGYDYYGDSNDDRLSPERALDKAIEAGTDMSVGPYEDARDHIDNEWWSHWEAITGKRGKRDDYFSCSC